ncbi:MAG: peroxiredoxin family protein, partial [Blastocatellia bacterium]
MSGNLKKLAAAAGLLILISGNSMAQEDLVFLSPAGQRVTLSSLRGKVVLLFFSGVQDPQCRDEFKMLQSLTDRYRNKDVSIFWVSVNPASVASDERLKSPCGPAGNVAVLRDPDQSAYRRLATGIKQLPTIVVLDKQGQAGAKA